MTVNENFKLFIFNSLAFAFSFANIEQYLKIILLLCSIVYTCIQIYKTLTKKNNANK